MGFKITYSVMNEDMDKVHAAFEEALEKAKADRGQTYPSYLGGEPLETGSFIESHSPIDGALLARVHTASPDHLDTAFDNARRAQKEWAALPWEERVRRMNKVADNISDNAPYYAAAMAMEVGKNRLEALGDVEEAADLIRYYASQVADAKGFVKPLNKLSPNEHVQSVLKPFGVFAVISPFNFPAALAAGMSGGALVAGNAVIIKPAEDTPWCSELLYRAFADSELPKGLFQMLHGVGEVLGAAIVDRDDLDGIAFTGSSAVGRHIFHTINNKRIRPVYMEMGGKNPCIIAESADLEKAVEGCYKSAFGLSGQKCSALSRVYVHSSLKDAFVEKLVAKVGDMRVGDPTEREVYMGPVINKDAVARYNKAAEAVKADGTVYAGAKELTDGEYAKGNFVAPTVAEVPKDHWVEKTELFLPFVVVSAFDDLDEAMARANDTEYGLTAGFFSAKEDEIDWFLENIEAGCVYVNRPAGATTGAWPGTQAFPGWKASGSTGKGGCGPHYVAQFLREQSHTVVR